MRGQVITIALVVACGIAVLVAAMATYQSLLASQATFYDEAHFSAVFASAKRVPLAVAAPIATIPGIGLVETRVAEDVTVTVHGGGEPLTAHVISLPDEGQPQLNRLYLRQGRLIASGSADEVLVSEAFAGANRTSPRGFDQRYFKRPTAPAPHCGYCVVGGICVRDPPG